MWGIEYETKDHISEKIKELDINIQRLLNAMEKELDQSLKIKEQAKDKHRWQFWRRE